jgi:hypothetical protein
MALAQTRRSTHVATNSTSVLEEATMSPSTVPFQTVKSAMAGLPIVDRSVLRRVPDGDWPQTDLTPGSLDDAIDDVSRKFDEKDSGYVDPAFHQYDEYVEIVRYLGGGNENGIGVVRTGADEFICKHWDCRD